MKKYAFLLILLVFALTVSAQSSGGEIRRGSSAAHKPQVTQRRGGTSSSRRHSTNTHRRSQKHAVPNDDKEEVDLTPEDFFRWGEEDYEAKNYSEAKEWYEMAANGGHILSQYYLGYMYENGEGCTHDYNKALEWYLKAIENKHAKAARRAAYLFYEGKGVSQNYQTAFTLFSKAAEWSDTTAKFALAYLYENGQGVTANTELATKWYNAFALDIIPNAKSSMEKNGQYVIDDLKIVAYGSSRYYAAPALCYIGYIYYYGKGGIKQNYAEAVEYFRQADEKGSKSAAYYLGLCYEFGEGVKVDDDIAEKYYDKSGYKTKSEADKYMNYLTGTY